MTCSLNTAKHEQIGIHGKRKRRMALTTCHIRTNAYPATKGQQRRLAASGSAGRVLGVVRIRGPAPDVVGRLKTQQGDGDVGFDIRHRACILQKPYEGAVFRLGVPNKRRVSDGSIVTADDNRVLERDGDACERPLQVDR